MLYIKILYSRINNARACTINNKVYNTTNNVYLGTYTPL